MGNVKPVDNATSAASGSKSPLVREQLDIDNERRRIIAEHIASLREMLRRLLNKLH
jgi:hypothetical protein